MQTTIEALEKDCAQYVAAHLESFKDLLKVTPVPGISAEEYLEHQLRQIVTITYMAASGNESNRQSRALPIQLRKQAS